MALNKDAFKLKLKEILSKPKTSSNVDTTAEEIAEAIEEFIKSGTVNGLCPPNGGALQQGKIT